MKTKNNNLSHLKNGWLMALGFFLTLWVLFIAYWALVNLPAKVWTGSWLTANSWNQIVDSLTELDSKTVPSWAILMFNTSCPATGWTRVTALDNKFPRGATTYGTTGWADAHTHAATGLLWPGHTHTTAWHVLTIAEIPSHNHQVADWTAPTWWSYARSRWWQVFTISPWAPTTYVWWGWTHTHWDTWSAWNTAVTGNTASSGNVPAYVTVVFCVKN